MDFSKFEELTHEYKSNITYLYIYYILTFEETLPENIKNNNLALEKLILLIENTYLYRNQPFDLKFICEVAVSYIEEIFEDNLNEEDLDNLCSETLLNS
ncbi:MAG: hypothetical protein IJW20_07280 [Clostridia bacterium]|nr:hypothetical protein [Clostridia bacterium]